MSRSTIPAPAHQPGDLVHGFRIQAVTEIPDIRALAYEATHEKTGAQLLHVHCNDEENMFSVGFRTPPSDSTGVAHILEHCVLAGSKKYPVKDAFNELGKRTLNTFLNAMTWPDRTVYPVCSPVKADYFNLASVYSDLVFNPLITKQTFQREGHHLEIEEKPADGKDAKLKISGVVFNEMKGVYSSPESFITRRLYRSLLPDTPYGVDSGGDPAAIPDLTYEQFVDFHRQFYSPSNARFLLYGDISTAENLAFLEKTLEGFERVEVDSALPLQPTWDAPRQMELEYPIGKDESTENKTFVTLGWLLGESTDVAEILKLEIAMFALVSSAASPMRKALIDSGLGKSLFPGHSFDADIKQASVTLGLRDTSADKADEIEALILDTLKDVVANGLDDELIEASFHHVAFHTREIVPPFPLMILYRANPPWYFGGDPKTGLAFGEALESIRAEYKENPRVFVDLLQKWLLDNNHRMRVVANPAPDLIDRWDEAEQKRLTQKAASLTEDEIKEIEEDTAILQKEQETPDTPEALASLPQIKLDEIPRRVFTIPEEESTLGNTDVLEHKLFSNGIGYVGLSFDTHDLSDDEAILLPFMGRASLGLGAGELDYEAQAKRVARALGGISASPTTGRNLQTGARYEKLVVDVKVLPHNAPQMVEILRDVFLKSRTDEHKRLRDMLQESAARSKSGLIPRGHAYAYTRAAATLGVTHWRSEQWGGTTQIQFLGKEAAAIGSEGGVESLAERIKALQTKIFTRARVQVSLAGDPEIVDALKPHVSALLDSLPAGSPAGPDTSAIPGLGDATGVIIGGQVNYVSQILQVPTFLDPAAPAIELMTQLLSNDLLYNKLRVQGGAYGGFAFYLRDSGLLPVVSYRDPNLAETFAVYESIADYLRSDALTDEAIDATRIGTIGSFDRILSPGQQLSAARGRRWLGLTHEHRVAFRNGLFEATAEDIRKLALPHLEKSLEGAPRAALASRQALEAANETMDRKLNLFLFE